MVIGPLISVDSIIVAKSLYVNNIYLNIMLDMKLCDDAFSSTYSGIPMRLCVSELLLKRLN